MVLIRERHAILTVSTVYKVIGKFSKKVVVPMKAESKARVGGLLGLTPRFIVVLKRED